MKFFRNLSTNFLLFVINIFIGLWLPPFIIKKLGVSAYGLIPLATAVSSYALIIAIIINGSIARYLILDITNKDYIQANRTFNTCFVGLSLLFLLLVPLLLGFSLNVESFVNVPTNLIEQAHFLFLYIFISFIIGTYTSLLNTSPYINNRLDLINLSNLINVSIKLLSIIILFCYFSVSLRSFGLAHIIASISALFISYIIFKKQTPYLKIKIGSFNFPILREILSMGGWLLVSQIGALLFLQIDLFLINLIKGPKEAGFYSILLPWNVLIRTFAAVIAGVISPVILKYYAENKTIETLKLSKLSVKYLGILISLIIGLLSAHAKEILTLWVGTEYSHLNKLFIILIFHLGLNLSVIPLFSITNAHKKVKIPGIVTILLGLVNLLLAVILLKYSSLELYGVALAGFIVLTFKNVFFAAPYTAHILGLKKTYYAKSMLYSVLVLLFTYLIGSLINDMMLIKTWVALMSSMAVTGILSLMVLYFFLVTKEEKLLMKHLHFSFKIRK